MRTVLTALALTLLLTLPLRAADAPPPPDKPRIDVVFCIDCSGSMGPVIETAKQKVWAIVNEIARAKPAPELRIGLIGYGNATGPFPTFPLSADLDDVYKNLLPFNDRLGGDEFVGLAIHRATTEMMWSQGKQVMKVIYVVGNETARQGPPEFDYAKTAAAAIAQGIMVNAIYCGDYEYQTATPSWRELAKLADGAYIEIAAQGGAVVVETPFDKDLNALSSKLNTTYVGYGRQREVKAAAQSAADASSAGLSPASGADRAVAKSSRQYDNAAWDLVDASRDKAFDVRTLKDEELPEDLRKLTPDQRAAHVQAKAKERDAIAAQIKELAAKRDAYVRDEVTKKGLDTNKSFDQAVRKSLTEQAGKKGFQFDQEEK
jgi:hypothetical protein